MLCRKKMPLVAYYLLLESIKYSLVIDLGTLNSVIYSLNKNNKLATSLELVKKVQIGDFGSRLRCDVSSYSMIIESASRLQDRDLLSTAFHLLYLDKNVFKQTKNKRFRNDHNFLQMPNIIDNNANSPSNNNNNNNNNHNNDNNINDIYNNSPNVINSNQIVAYKDIDDRLFIQSLVVSSCNGDITSCLDIIDMYRTVMIYIPTKAYSMMLASVLYSSDKNISDVIIDRIDSIIEYIIEFNIDHDKSISLQLFRYFSEIKKNLGLAELYMNRITKVLGQRPSTLGLIQYDY